MKKSILTAVFAFAPLVQAFGPQERIICQAPDLGTFVLESGTFKERTSAYDFVVDNPGTLTLQTASGATERVHPSEGVGGIFNEYVFPRYFVSLNDAKKPHILKFETRQLGQLQVSSVCNKPNAFYCEDRSGEITRTARVTININGERILKFDGRALPFCERKLLPR